MTTRSDLPAAGAFLKEHVQPGTRVLCAVSGGRDSMCLLHFLTASGGCRPALRVTAAHFNHRLRGAEADRDENFVREYCRTHGIPCICGSGDTAARAKAEHETEEEAARALRYAFLQRTAEEQNCRWIATAHHASDSAETILLNLIRGTGLRGLTGIPETRDNLIRPFLGVTRSELAAYAERWDLPHVEDSTNAADEAARNILRHRVFPILEELNPRAAEHMARTGELLRTVDGELEDAAQRTLIHAVVEGNRVSLALDGLEGVPQSVLPRVLLGLFDRLGVGRKDITAVHLKAAAALCRSGGDGGRLSLPHGVSARQADGNLILEMVPRPLEAQILETGIPQEWGDWILTLLPRPAGEGLSLRTGGERICVAPARPDARLTLPGTHGGGRTVKRLCVDRKIPLSLRDRLPAFSADGRLAAVWPLGVNLEFLPEGESCRFIQIIKKTEENKV